MMNLGAGAIGIGMAVRLRDQFSTPAQVVAASMRNLDREQKLLMRNNLNAARSLGMTSAILGGLVTYGFASATKSAAEYGWAMKGVEAIVSNEITNNRQRAMWMDKLNDKAISLSKRYIFSATEIASAQEYLARAGFGAYDIDKTIEAVTRLGAATDTQIGGHGGAADMMTNMMTAFKMTADQSEWMADILTRTTTSANIEISDLHESLKYMGSAASAMGVSFEASAAMIAVLGNAGIRGGIAGRGLANMLIYLSKAAGQFATKQQIDVLRSIGMAPEQVRSVMNSRAGIVGVLAMMKDATKGMDKVSRLDILTRLFNIRGGRSIEPLLRALDVGESKMGRSFMEMLQELNDESAKSMAGYGAATRIAEMRMQSLKGAMIIVKDTWIAFKIAVGNTLKPVLMPIFVMIVKILTLLEGFAKTKAGKVFFIIAAGMGVMLLVGGLLIAMMASIGLAQLSIGVSASNMGTALTAAWNSATGAALRYQMVAGGAATAIPFMPGYRDVKTGRFVGQSMIKGVKGAGGITSILGMLGRFGSVLGRATVFLLRFIGPIGIIVSILGAIVGWNNIIKGVVLVFKLLGYYGVMAGIAFQRMIDTLQFGADDARVLYEGRRASAQQEFGLVPDKTQLAKELAMRKLLAEAYKGWALNQAASGTVQPGFSFKGPSPENATEWRINIILDGTEFRTVKRLEAGKEETVIINPYE